MKAEQGCAGCIIDDISGAVKLMGVDNATQLTVMNQAMKYLSENFNFDTLPSVYITEVHRIAKKVTGQRLPFEQLRKNCNDVGLALSDKLALKLASMPDTLERFETLVKWVIASNHLDFRTVGTGYEVPIAKIEEHVLTKVREPLQVNDLPVFYKFVNEVPKTWAMNAAVSDGGIGGTMGLGGTSSPQNPGARSAPHHNNFAKPHALFIHDNVGEIAFDRYLIADLRARGWFVMSALRGGPITSDATLEDGLYVKMQDYADMIICAGPDTLGISWEEKSPELEEALQKCDLIISKGQANFYLFSDHQKQLAKPVMCLLTTKCPYVSSYFQKSDLISVAKFLI